MFLHSFTYIIVYHFRGSHVEEGSLTFINQVALNMIKSTYLSSHLKVTNSLLKMFVLQVFVLILFTVYNIPVIVKM